MAGSRKASDRSEKRSSAAKSKTPSRSRSRSKSGSESPEPSQPTTPTTPPELILDPQTVAQTEAEQASARAAGGPRRSQTRQRAGTGKKRGRRSKEQIETEEREARLAPIKEEMALIVDLQNSMTRGLNKQFRESCGLLQEAPLIDDEARDQWAGRAAAVADKYGGQLPFMVELLFLASTVVSFGPTYVVLFGNWRVAKQLQAEQADAKTDPKNPPAAGEGKSAAA